MTLASAAILILAALFTAMLSGVFGMAGGLVLMGILVFVVPVQAAFVTHGLLQLVANGWRMILHRRHVRWDIAGWYALASMLAGLVAAILSFAPSKPVLFVLLGLVPLLTWLPPHLFALDAARPHHAFLSGLSVTGLNLTAGVAGPLLDIFFVRTQLSRHAIVATKAATQVFSHLAKIVVFGAPMLTSNVPTLPPPWVFAMAIPLSMLGTVAGGRILDRMSDRNFRDTTRWIVTAIGLTYLIRGVQLMLAD